MRRTSGHPQTSLPWRRWLPTVLILTLAALTCLFLLPASASAHLPTVKPRFHTKHEEEEYIAKVTDFGVTEQDLESTFTTEQNEIKLEINNFLAAQAQPNNQLAISTLEQAANTHAQELAKTFLTDINPFTVKVKDFYDLCESWFTTRTDKTKLFNATKTLHIGMQAYGAAWDLLVGAEQALATGDTDTANADCNSASTTLNNADITEGQTGLEELEGGPWS